MVRETVVANPSPEEERQRDAALRPRWFARLSARKPSCNG